MRGLARSLARSQISFIFHTVVVRPDAHAQGTLEFWRKACVDASTVDGTLSVHFSTDAGATWTPLDAVGGVVSRVWLRSNLLLPAAALKARTRFRFVSTFASFAIDSVAVLPFVCGPAAATLSNSTSNAFDRRCGNRGSCPAANAAACVCDPNYVGVDCELYRPSAPSNAPCNLSVVSLL